MSEPTITAFAQSPDRGRGLARDTRVRWALEEVGQPYGVRLPSFAQLKEPEYRALQPFGQIPAYQEGDLVLFETGAIVLHIAETRAGLLPGEAGARARAIAWMFAALSTLEPPLIDLSIALRVEHDQPWHADRLPLVKDRLRKRLADLEQRLGDGEWLEGDFSAGDLMVIDVLRRLGGTPLLGEFARLAAYVARGEARPAFQRAFAAQRAVFQAAQEAAS